MSRCAIRSSAARLFTPGTKVRGFPCGVCGVTALCLSGFARGLWSLRLDVCTDRDSYGFGSALRYVGERSLLSAAHLDAFFPARLLRGPSPLIRVSKQGTACQPPFHAADGSSRRRFSAGSMAAPDAAAPDFTKTGPVWIGSLSSGRQKNRVWCRPSPAKRVLPL